MASVQALTVSAAKFNEVLAKAERAERQLKGVKAAGEQHVGTVFTALEITTAGVALGYQRGRFGEKTLGGIPVEVLGGIAGHLLGFSGLAGQHASHVHNLSTEAIAFVGCVEGLRMGTEHRKRAAALSSAAAQISSGAEAPRAIEPNRVGPPQAQPAPNGAAVNNGHALPQRSVNDLADAMRVQPKKAAARSRAKAA